MNLKSLLKTDSSTLARLPQLITLTLLLSFLTVIAQQERVQLQVGEELQYSVYYRFAFISIPAATVSFSIQEADKNSIKIEALGNTLPTYNWFFCVNDTLVSTVEKPSGYPITFYRASNEGNYHERFWHFFQNKKERILSIRQPLGEEKKISTLPLTTPIFDIVSAAFYIKATPFTATQIGEKQTISVMLSDTVYSIPYTYLGKEEVELPNGKKYIAKKIAATMVEGTIFNNNDHVTIWVTNDEQQTPLKVVAEIIIGKVEVFYNN